MLVFVVAHSPSMEDMRNLAAEMKEREAEVAETKAQIKKFEKQIVRLSCLVVVVLDFAVRNTTLPLSL